MPSVFWHQQWACIGSHPYVEWLTNSVEQNHFEKVTPTHRNIRHQPLPYTQFIYNYHTSLSLPLAPISEQRKTDDRSLFSLLIGKGPWSGELTDYYGLANGWGYLRLICFIFVPFISCRYKNKLFLPHLPRPSPTCNLFSPNTPFPFILLVGHCTSTASSTELTNRWDTHCMSSFRSNMQKVWCH